LGSTAGFATGGTVFNDELATVPYPGTNPPTFWPPQYTTSECRAADFLTENSLCYRTFCSYEGKTSSGDYSAGTPLDGCLRSKWIKPQTIFTDFTADDIEDRFRLTFTFSEAVVQLVTKINAIRTWKDVVGSLGGLLTAAAAVVLVIIGQAMDATDSEGELATKVKRAAAIGKTAAEKSALASGFDLDPETPDVVFHEKIKALEGEEDSDEELPVEFDAIVERHMNRA